MNPPKVRRRPPMGYERRMLLFAVALALPGIAAALLFAWLGPFTTRLAWTVTGVLALLLLLGMAAFHDQLVHPLRTLSNILGALREEDYSLRGRAVDPDDALGEVMTEVNALSANLRERRLDALEATALVSAALSEIDAAIFAFDGEERLRLVNPAGERLLAQPSERLLGADAWTLGVADLLADEHSGGTFDRVFPGASGRFGFRRSLFREKGRSHQLLVIADLSRALREEERQAWQRLVRVMGHELNNSLAPITSISQSLGGIVAREPLPDDWREDVRRGLEIISSRGEALGRFVNGYAKLTRLPAPTLAPIDLGALVRRTAALDQRLAVTVADAPPIRIRADEAQLEQLLINLLRNAVDAALETGGGVTVTMRRKSGFAEVCIVDDGPGLSGSANLFVPFFTTKPGGSGIGLVLSRQIAEAHGGSLTLANREEARGVEAVLRLPL